MLRVMRSSDAGEVLEKCTQWLAARPVERNVAISLLKDRAERGIEGRYWWVEEPREELASGSCSRPRSRWWPASCRRPRPEVVALLAAAVAEEVPDLPGAVGEAATVAAFAGSFATLRKCPAAPVEGQRSTACTPAPWRRRRVFPGGSARPTCRITRW